MRSTAEWRQDDREDRTVAIPFEQELALMLAHDPIGHEQTEPRPALFGREVGLEQVMPLVVGNARPIVRHAEIGPAVSTPTGLQLDMAVDWNCIDGVVDQVGNDFS
jgi:hypothetical protein